MLVTYSKISRESQRANTQKSLFLLNLIPIYNLRRDIFDFNLIPLQIKNTRYFDHFSL